MASPRPIAIDPVAVDNDHEALDFAIALGEELAAAKFQAKTWAGGPRASLELEIHERIAAKFRDYVRQFGFHSETFDSRAPQMVSIVVTRRRP